jgi:hypothetical protein
MIKAGNEVEVRDGHGVIRNLPNCANCAKQFTICTICSGWYCDCKPSDADTCEETRAAEAGLTEEGETLVEVFDGGYAWKVLASEAENIERHDEFERAADHEFERAAEAAESE